jgi:hypothetical protein
MAQGFPDKVIQGNVTSFSALNEDMPDVVDHPTLLLAANIK